MDTPAWIVLVPARYASTRLPGKVLLEARGKPLVRYVVERARAAPGGPRVIVLTDDDRVEAAVRGFGGEVMRTPGHLPSGSDRCAFAARELDAPVFVNVQGDEPLFAPADLAALAEAVATEQADIATLGWPFSDPAERAAPSNVKVLVRRDGFAVGFQRADTDPDTRAARQDGIAVLHHVGIYAFRRDRLLAFPDLAPTPGEQRERLEQLRALEHGWRIRVLGATAPAFGVDTPEDWARFEMLLARPDL